MPINNSPATIEEAYAEIAGWASLTESDMPDDWTTPSVETATEGEVLVRFAYEQCGLTPSFLIPYNVEWEAHGEELGVDFDGTGDFSFLIDHEPAKRFPEPKRAYTCEEHVPLERVKEVILSFGRLDTTTNRD